MQRSFPLSVSLKLQLLIGLGVGLWTVLFLILLSPFDVSDLSTKFRFLLMPAYGFLFWISYSIALLVQYTLHRRYERWQVWMEGLFLLTFLIICFACSVTYYRSSILNGELRPFQFLLQQFIPLAIIVIPLLVFLRWAAGRYFSRKQEKTAAPIIFRGSLKKDLLRVAADHILLIKAADNYIEINYLSKKDTKQYLLRSTLKQAAETAPHLIRTHRSYLINPTHFEHWISPNELSIAGVSVPVSKTYKKQLEAQLSSATNS